MMTSKRLIQLSFRRWVCLEAAPVGVAFSPTYVVQNRARVWKRYRLGSSFRPGCRFLAAATSRYRLGVFAQHPVGLVSVARQLRALSRQRLGMLTQPLIDALQTVVMPFPAGLPLRWCRKAPATNKETATAQPHGATLDRIVQATLEPFGCHFARSSICPPKADCRLRCERATIVAPYAPVLRLRVSGSTTSTRCKGWTWQESMLAGRRRSPNGCGRRPASLRAICSRSRCRATIWWCASCPWRRTKPTSTAYLGRLTNGTCQRMRRLGAVYKAAGTLGGNA